MSVQNTVKFGCIEKYCDNKYFINIFVSIYNQLSFKLKYKYIFKLLYTCRKDQSRSMLLVYLAIIVSENPLSLLAFIKGNMIPDINNILEHSSALISNSKKNK